MGWERLATMWSCDVAECRVQLPYGTRAWVDVGGIVRCEACQERHQRLMIAGDDPEPVVVSRRRNRKRRRLGGLTSLSNG